MLQDFSSESEWKTRKTRIEPKLRSAGWDVVSFDPVKTLDNYDNCAIAEYPTTAGPADYALCLGGRILGVIEAKRLTLVLSCNNARYMISSWYGKSM